MQLFTVLAKTADWHMSEFNAQGLANTAWAFAMVGQPDAQLFMALARVAELRLDNFNTQELANAAWAAAKAFHPDA